MISVDWSYILLHAPVPQCGQKIKIEILKRSWPLCKPNIARHLIHFACRLQIILPLEQGKCSGIFALIRGATGVTRAPKPSKVPITRQCAAATAFYFCKNMVLLVLPPIAPLLILFYNRKEKCMIVPQGFCIKQFCNATKSFFTKSSGPYWHELLTCMTTMAAESGCWCGVSCNFCWRGWYLLLNCD